MYYERCPGSKEFNLGDTMKDGMKRKVGSLPGLPNEGWQSRVHEGYGQSVWSHQVGDFVGHDDLTSPNLLLPLIYSTSNTPTTFYLLSLQLLLLLLLMLLLLLPLLLLLLSLLLLQLLPQLLLLLLLP